MSKPRKSRMASFLRRQMRRTLAKRISNGEHGALAAADVVLCTTSAAADSSVLKLPLFDTVLLDEASQASQPNSWLPLLRGARCVLLGDPKQLPPTVVCSEAVAGGLAVSLLEWAMAELPSASCMLKTQRRMHASICEWPSHTMYGGSLRAHPSVATHLLAQLPGVQASPSTSTPLVGIDVQLGRGGGGEKRDAQGGITNPTEAEAVLSHARELLAAGVEPAAIAVVSAYAAQVALLATLFERSAAEGEPELREVEVATIDAYQGREAEALIVSLVRSNEDAVVGFLSDERRLNVAVTRARRHLAIVMDSRTLRRHGLLKSLIDHVATKGTWRSYEPCVRAEAPASE